MKYAQLVQYFKDALKAEEKSTHLCLERIPETLYKFKPHERSMELGYLAALVADIPRWITLTIRDAQVDFATYTHFQLSDTAALVKRFEENIQDALQAFDHATETQLERTFELRNGPQLLYSTPVLKGIGEDLHHWVHHRGQLTVYMRLNEIAVPSIYGPSADDKKF